MKKFIIITSVCLFCMIGNVNAADDSLTVSCSEEKITIKGNGNISENELISFVCVDNPDALNELGDENVPYFVEAVNAENYEINAVINIPDNMSGGKYYIVAQGEDYCASAHFVFVDEEKIEAALDKINSAKSPAALGKVLEEAVIDLDDEIYSQDSELINLILYTGRGNGYTTESFINTLYDSYFASLTCNGKSDEAFGVYGVYDDGDKLSEQYYKLSNVSDFEEIFKNSEFDKYSVFELCSMAILTANVKTSQNWKEIRNEILMNDSTTPTGNAKKYFDFSYYNKLKDKNTVFQKMAEKISGIESFGELKKIFEDTAKSVYESENKSDKGSSGGGSSSGGGNSGGMYSPVIPEQTNEGNTGEKLFSDIDGHWAKGDIEKLNKKGIINGYSDKTFRPDNYVTRAEMVKMICLAFSLAGNSEMNFSDVSENDWYYEYINTAYTNGVVNGNGDGFSPQENITREDAAVIMYRILSKNYPVEGATLSFIDKSEISDYAKEAIGAMKNEGIIEGVGKNKFEPKSPITRAQCAVLINRCILRFEITE